MLLGVGILANSLIYVGIIMPLFLFIYQAIVLAEEHFLRGKFGADFDTYCSKSQPLDSFLEGDKGNILLHGVQLGNAGCSRNTLPSSSGWRVLYC